MNEKSLREALTLAREFERLARDLQSAYRAQDGSHPSPKLTGAVRRKSLDLTRALADMRRPG